MNGPEHYREAERLLRLVERRASRPYWSAEETFRKVALEAAHVHAELARVAVMADAQIATGKLRNAQEWIDALQ